MAFTNNAFIKLWYPSQSETLAKALRVAGGGYTKEIEKAEKIKRTLGGRIDVTYGGLYVVEKFVIKITESTSEVTPVEENPIAGNKTYAYANLAELEAFFKYKGRLKYKGFFQNFDATATDAVTVDTLQEQPASVIIKGNNSWWMLNLTLIWEA